jgi:subtilase-type proteinase RRT12
MTLLALLLGFVSVIGVSVANYSDYIIQITPEITVDHFLSVYPSLGYTMEGQLSIGKFQAIYGNFDKRLVRYLSYSTLVVDVTTDAVVRILDVQTYAPRHLARLSQTERLKSQGPYDYVYDPSGGFGIDVYVFDTGIDVSQEEFEGRAQTGVDFTGEGLGDENGHGTFVAGLVGSKTYGVAKRVNIIDVKTMNSAGRGKLSWVLAGIEYVIASKANRNRKSVINMSLGTPKSNMFNRAVQQIVEMGIPVIAAAGNADSNACRYSPASAHGALVIGALDDRTDSAATFSNWGECVDAFAPGVNVESVSIFEGGSPVLYSGTSVASPVGAGLIAYFMGMGDSGDQAVRRAKELRVKGNISRTSLIFKPWTENAILYNESGEPLW